MYNSLCCKRVPFIAVKQLRVDETMKEGKLVVADVMFCRGCRRFQISYKRHLSFFYLLTIANLPFTSVFVETRKLFDQKRALHREWGTPLLTDIINSFRSGLHPKTGQPHAEVVRSDREKREMECLTSITAKEQADFDEMRDAKRCQKRRRQKIEMLNVVESASNKRDAERSEASGRSPDGFKQKEKTARQVANLPLTSVFVETRQLFDQKGALHQKVRVQQISCVVSDFQEVIASTKTSGTPVIGATMDMTSRAGKEARVAMEIAVDDFNTKTQKNVTLYTRNSKGKVVQAINDGVVGLGSFFPDSGSQFHDFSTKFRKKFMIEQPEEENNMPGIFAVQAYDATWIAALTLSVKNMSEQTFLDTISSISLAGIRGEVQLVNKKPAASHVFNIINVVGKYYRQLGFWSEGLGFSEVINDRATYDTALQNLGHIFWPGRPLHTPRGWAIPTHVKPLRVGVPTMAMFKKFVKVKYDQRHHNFTYTGYSIELFKETVRHLPYYMPYEFHPFTGTYDSLVQQVYLKNFDAVVGDVSVVSWRYEYAEFTHPYTETGLVMVVPVASYHGHWLFLKPFTLNMWALTIFVNIYCGFVCYTASLTSMLTVTRLIPKVTDCETLKNSNAVVGYDRGSQVASYLVNVLRFKHENIKSFTSPEDYAQALENKEIAAIFLAAPYAKLFVTKYCKRFIAFPKGSPMVSDFTKALLNVSESGTLRDIKKRTLGSEHCVDPETIQDQYGSLGLASFWSLFLLAGGTSTIALVIYVMQNLCQLERRSLITILTEVRKYFVCRRKRLSKKVSDVESVESPNAKEIT
ncbi:hypothetical protein L1987_31658 [Smallanthus sonchifolius]|uniref:Uncharacterized protein n=1 Tax=Smallanthus sonchifolius TaxID=185202 RepID=A0ACB9I7L2_9ASTR|nr:hypothetical protein L1987_31658 [Smallanthus sonchifolius]